MKAIVRTKYGPQAGELLVKVHAASLNYGDSILVRGQPFLIRLMGYAKKRRAGNGYGWAASCLGT